MNIREYKLSRIILATMMVLLWISFGTFSLSADERGAKTLRLVNKTNYVLHISKLAFVSANGYPGWDIDQKIPKGTTNITPGIACPWLRTNILDQQCYFNDKSWDRSNWFFISIDAPDSRSYPVDVIKEASGQFPVDPMCSAQHGDTKCIAIKWDAVKESADVWVVTFTQENVETGLMSL